MNELIPRQKLVSFTLIIGLAISFFNCERNADEFGNEFLSRRDSVPVLKDTLYNFSTFLEREPELPTNGTNSLIFGNITDEYFGQTRSYALGQYFINTEVDSGTVIPPENVEAEMIIEPDEHFGDSEYFEQMEIALYEVNKSLDLAASHFSNENPEDYYSTSDPEISESISFQGDSIIKIKLTSEFTQKLNERSFETVDDTLYFTEAIKGILFSMKNSEGNGGLISAPVQNCTMHLYYTEVEDTTNETDTIDYKINTDFGVRFNMFEHDYSQATGTPNAHNVLESEGEDSLLFVQNLQGTWARVTFAETDLMREKYKDKLLANASLIFDVKENYNHIVDSTVSNMRAVIYNDNGEEENTQYVYLNNYFGSLFNQQFQPYEAYFDKKNNEMVFNITGYCQSLINNRIDNNTIYLHTPNRAKSFRQIVLSGSSSESPARLEIDYYNTSE